MKHSDMQHDHMMMDHQAASISQHSIHSEIHHYSIETFWTLSNNFEIALTILFIVFFILKREKWQQHPFIIAITSLLFFISMNPLIDTIARHSVWLHCLQSSLIHHLIPLALLMSTKPIITHHTHPPSAQTTQLMLFSIVAFNVMSLMWILPALHIQMMQNALLYSLMKWAMAITGILLCQSMQAFNNHQYIAGLDYKKFNTITILPQILIGVALIMLPPVYAMPDALMQHIHSLPLAPFLPKLAERDDQIAGGFILLLASLLFLFTDIKRRLTFSTLQLHTNKARSLYE